MVSLIKIWRRFLEECHDESMNGLPAYPEHIAAVGALMKAKGHRLFSNYVSWAKEEHGHVG